ncbi:EscU/YscU/HrcU family type III secretion system export apparatus switch protein [Biostraticola tofi]|nr:EscU/YscU/HrcU family type III secretion system export apparatus switch protein [Biostraticola tofi]
MANKTEKPTPKRLKDASKKGQSFKGRDFIIACLMLCGVAWLTKVFDLTGLMEVYRHVIEADFNKDITAYFVEILIVALKIILPVLVICIVSSALPSLLQTGFVVASKALKLNFEALSPAKGFKKIFSLRTVKDTIKTMLYFLSFVFAFIITWKNNADLLFSSVNVEPITVVMIFRHILFSLVLTCLACIVIIFILDALADFFLHLKTLKMEKQEVKREMKEQDGNPEIKHRRRELHIEILSEQIKSDIRSSKAIIVNPTHIAVGIYYQPDLFPRPIISLIDFNQRALAVKKYAQEVGVPIVRDFKLARRLASTHSRYSYVSLDKVDEIMRLLDWLKQVDEAWKQ